MTYMFKPAPVPSPPNRGRSAPSTEDTPFVQADFPHDTFTATPTPVYCKDTESVGKGTKGSAPGRAANPVPQRC